MVREELVTWLHAEARRLGLAQIAIAPVEIVPQHRLFSAWLAADRCGEMVYLRRDEASRRDPRALLAEARTVLCAALSYRHEIEEPAGLRGQIARYARGEDYHLVLKARLAQLAEAIGARLGGPVASRVCVDSAPLLERALAARAGLGFQGKNTLLITPGVGSYTVLGEILLDLELPVGQEASPRCGACRACIDVCPTGALLGEYVLDARRCISYLTIENEGPIPPPLRPLLGAWIFGCDLCQEVCPYNAAARPGDPELRPRPSLSAPELLPLLRIGAAQFRRLVRRSALRRIHRAQLLRNVAVALGNVGGAEAVGPLAEALSEPAPLVRSHVAWALGQIGRRLPAAAPEARRALQRALAAEVDDEARGEIAAALAATAAEALS